MAPKHKILGIYVGNERNLMYMVYNEKYAVAFDTTDVKILEHALKIEPRSMLMEKEDVLKSEAKVDRKLLAVFTTHHHWDHSHGNDDVMLLTENVFHGKNLEEKVYKFEDFEVFALSTPCHTEDSYSFLIDDYLILGDTLLYLGCGKFFEGTAKDMKACFEKLKKNVKPEVICCYGHDYADTGYKFAREYFDVPEEYRLKRLLTFGEELAYNPFINFQKLVDRKAIKGLTELRTIKNRYKGV
ncbi:Glyoxylase [Trachipleistophora hominis]|uniref:Glyoxylase n=1 Tax=Trachipleistophora hominis TaxID=72359 RepID=L7JT77_TRAHO|nr:Glyoxylase [Trachipleistophora hominis]